MNELLGPRIVPPQLTITNDEGLRRWIDERRKMGRNLTAIKGKAPDGATYSDGDPITKPVNIAWQDTTTGEIFGIEYAAPNDHVSGAHSVPLDAPVGREGGR